MEELKRLQLTEKDFDLLIKGLDLVVEKAASTTNMANMVDRLQWHGLPPELAPEANKLRSFLKSKAAEAESEWRMSNEDARILAGKLLMMKRYMQENNILTQVEEQLKTPIPPADAKNEDH